MPAQPRPMQRLCSLPSGLQWSGQSLRRKLRGCGGGIQMPHFTAEDMSRGKWMVKQAPLAGTLSWGGGVGGKLGFSDDIAECKLLARAQH